MSRNKRQTIYYTNIDLKSNYDYNKYNSITTLPLNLLDIGQNFVKFTYSAFLMLKMYVHQDIIYEIFLFIYGNELNNYKNISFNYSCSHEKERNFYTSLYSKIECKGISRCRHEGCGDIVKNSHFCYNHIKCNLCGLMLKKGYCDQCKPSKMTSNYVIINSENPLIIEQTDKSEYLIYNQDHSALELNLKI